VAQIQTAGLGITLTAADTAIFYSLDYSFANYDQARARLHRIGQRNSVTYIHLVARGTVDEKVLKALQKKKNVANEVVDNWRNYF
jgi:SNF2 family DNA or RNA helicase